jgi:hypothetical protein
VIGSKRVEVIGECGTCGGVEKYVQRSFGGNLKERGCTEAFFYALVVLLKKRA